MFGDVMPVVVAFASLFELRRDGSLGYLAEPEVLLNSEEAGLAGVIFVPEKMQRKRLTTAARCSRR